MTHGVGVQRVLCVRRLTLEGELGSIPLGLSLDPKHISALEMAVVRHGEFLPRPGLEEDPRYLQIIVQGLVTDGQRVLALFRKSREQGAGQFVETRHNAKIALCAGGHVEPIESGTPEMLCAALRRELNEELVFATPPLPSSLVPVGIVCNAAPEAPLFHRVHLGLVYRVPVSGEIRLPAGSDEFDGLEMLDLDRLRELLPRMEGWGQILAQALLAGQLWHLSRRSRRVSP